MNYSEIVSKVAEETGISKDIVNKTYKYFWKYIRETIQALPLKEDIDEETFNKTRPSFNIPSIGKMSCIYPKYIKMREKFNNINKIKSRSEKAD